MDKLIKMKLKHREVQVCIQRIPYLCISAQFLSINPDLCIQKNASRGKSGRRQSSPDLRSGLMNLRLLDFDCSEDADGVVCWDALAQPQTHHNSELLQEVSQVLAWAFCYDTQGPGQLEEGANWDFDLQATLHPSCQPPITADITFSPVTHVITLTPLALNQRIELSLSLSGTPGFAQAFRNHWGAP
jgi:hypothetical protein